MARSPSPAIASMSRSTLSVTMSSPALTRLGVGGDATCRGGGGPALARGFEAEDGARHADVERLGPSLHGDGEGPIEPAAEGRIEAGGLVAQEHGGGDGPVQRRVVLTLVHDGGQRPQPRRGQLGRDLAGSSRTTSGTWNSEPAVARTVLGLYGSTDSAAKTTAWAPAASAARSTVPALPGSRTSTRTSTSEPGRAADQTAAGGCVQHGQHGEHRLRCHRVGDPFEDAGGQWEDPGAGDAGPAADLLDRPIGVALGRHVHGLDRCAGLEGAADQLGPFGHEGAFGPARRTLLQQPAQPADPPVREGKPLGQEATSVAEAGAAASASCAVCTSAPNASGSLTARSASTLRSTSTPARCRPLIRRL